MGDPLIREVENLVVSFLKGSCERDCRTDVFWNKLEDLGGTQPSLQTTKPISLAEQIVRHNVLDSLHSLVIGACDECCKRSIVSLVDAIRVLRTKVTDLQDASHLASVVLSNPAVSEGLTGYFHNVLSRSGIWSSGAASKAIVSIMASGSTSYTHIAKGDVVATRQALTGRWLTRVGNKVDEDCASGVGGTEEASSDFAPLKPSAKSAALGILGFLSDVCKRAALSQHSIISKSSDSSVDEKSTALVREQLSLDSSSVSTRWIPLIIRLVEVDSVTVQSSALITLTGVLRHSSNVPRGSGRLSDIAFPLMNAVKAAAPILSDVETKMGPFVTAFCTCSIAVQKDCYGMLEDLQYLVTNVGRWCCSGHPSRMGVFLASSRFFLKAVGKWDDGDLMLEFTLQEWYELVFEALQTVWVRPESGNSPHEEGLRSLLTLLRLTRQRTSFFCQDVWLHLSCTNDQRNAAVVRECAREILLGSPNSLATLWTKPQLMEVVIAGVYDLL
eukprot:GHVN01018983.1.p1 GENE.GHVN01018983.1~~GHVN01018983.1.p1  ORF type:complete len:501 (+),score=32.75 GHVN01018983.1:2149-3651(+)